MDGPKVFILFHWTDNRKENHVQILSVHLSKKDAHRALQKAVNQHVKDLYKVDEINRFKEDSCKTVSVYADGSFDIFQVVKKVVMP